jgi:hypothetical protein
MEQAVPLVKFIVAMHIIAMAYGKAIAMSGAHNCGAP